MTEHVMDFETASGIELKSAGAWAYANHPTTEVLCLSFEDLHGDVLTWAPGRKTEEMWLRGCVANPEAIFVSHGDFERAIWHCIMVPTYGFPPLPNERWLDTMAVCAMKQLPLKLETVLAVLRLPIAKDMEGSKLTTSLSKVNKKSSMLDRSPATLARVYAYCESDVRAERALLNRVGHLQPSERPVWLLDQAINQRGIRIDLDYVRACQKVVDGALAPLDAEFAALTGGLRVAQRDAIMGWVGERTATVPDLRKETIEGLIGKGVEDDGDTDDVLHERESPIRLPGEVRRVLAIRQLAGSASIKKLGAMLACVSSDGRARGLLQYHRAGPGRWAGRLLQPQNFPRPSLKDEAGDLVKPEIIVAALMSGDWEWVETVAGPAIQTVVSGLRHALIADRRKVFMSGDYAQIEARIVLALAGQYDKVKLFETGTPYVDMAELIFGRTISKKNDIAEYTLGKNTVLGCGFQMGAARLFERYCPKQSAEFAQKVVTNYRKKWAPLVPPLWYGLEKAAVDTVWSGKPHSYVGVEYKLEDGFLTARLPSGRKLYYWNPQKDRRVMPWLDDDGDKVIRAAFTYQAMKAGRWTTIFAFGGLLTENVVQALARDQLVHAMLLLDEEGYPTVLTVHDEDLVEVEEKRLDEKAFAEILSDRPQWAIDMKVPIAVETWTGERYRK